MTEIGKFKELKVKSYPLLVIGYWLND